MITATESLNGELPCGNLVAKSLFDGVAIREFFYVESTESNLVEHTCDTEFDSVDS